MKEQETQLVKDILFKAAEDVKSGLWCKASWFKSHDNETQAALKNEEYKIFGLDDEGSEYQPSEWAAIRENLSEIAAFQRCAEGSLAYATLIAGLHERFYYRALEAVESRLDELCPLEQTDYHNHLGSDSFGGRSRARLWRHNDECIPHIIGHINSIGFQLAETDESRFAAGESLSELFRKVAEDL